MQSIQWYDFEIGEIIDRSQIEPIRDEWIKSALSDIPLAPAWWAENLYQKGYNLPYAKVIISRAYRLYCI